MHIFKQKIKHQLKRKKSQKSKMYVKKEISKQKQHRALNNHQDI